VLNKSNIYNAIARVNGDGFLRLRGGSGTISQNTANWIRLGNNNSGGFHLDMGASLSDRADIVLSEIWGDGTVAGAPKLSIASLSGHGFFRSDWGTGAGNRTISVNQDIDTTYSGRIIQNNSSSRSIILEKLGSGTLTLTQAHTINGLNVGGSGSLVLASGASVASAPVTVSDTATLLVNSGATAAGTISVASGAYLGGSGTIAGTTTISGFHTPGNSPGTQTFSNGISYETGSTLVWELIDNTLGTAGTDFDQVLVTGGDLTIDASTTINLVMNLGDSSVDWTDSFWGIDRSWLAVDFQSGGTSTGNFGTLTYTADSLGQSLTDIRPYASFTVDRDGDDIFVNYSAVPEPSALALFGLAGTAMLGIRRRSA
ncbi:MAG: PEP-CTERM sorting domain-containing protein, partial [Luteolibacter sp.]